MEKLSENTSTHFAIPKNTAKQHSTAKKHPHQYAPKPLQALIAPHIHPRTTITRESLYKLFPAI
jgi:hypothetical protein